MIPTLFEQVVAAQRLSPLHEAVKEKRNEKLRRIVDFLLDKNANAHHVAEHLGILHRTARIYLKDLEREGRIVSWLVGSTFWHTATDKERARLKHQSMPRRHL